MKILAIALGSLAIAAAASAHAQYGRDRPDDSRRMAQECWNRGAGHFEAVRPGERQDDLDFSRCRPVAGNWRESRRPSGEDECWNSHARHFEAVRPGERQDDLDFSRCRPRDGRYNEDPYRR